MQRRTLRPWLVGFLLAASLAWSGETKLDPTLFQRLRAFKMGANPGDCQAVANLTIAAIDDLELRKGLEAQLAAVLADKAATADAKSFVCRQLLTIATPASVPALAALLADKDLSHMARYALERNKCPEAGKALRAALGATQGRLLIGVVNSLGERRDAEAAAALTRLLKGSDAEVAGAAARALGKIAGDDAAKALAAARAEAKDPLRRIVDDAWLRCADQFLADGKSDKAKPIYETLYAPAEKKNVRAAALRGLVALGGDDAIALIIKPLMSNDAAMQSVAVSYIRDVPGAEATKAFAAQLPKLSPAAQVLVIGALATRGDAGAAAAVKAAAKSPSADVRLAALRALATMGDASVVLLLVEAASGEQKAEADAALASLTVLGGEGVDEAILELARKADAGLRADLIKLLAARTAKGALPDLLKFAEDADATVRKEAFTAIGKLADEKTLPELVGLVVKAKDDAALKAAERAVVTVARNIEDEAARAAALLSGLPTATGPGKVALLGVLGRFGGEKALAAVRAAVTDQDPKVQDAAIRTLADWPDASPTDDLRTIMRTTKSPVHRVLALRGYVRLLALPSTQPIGEILKRYDEVMQLAASVADKKLILSGMAELRHPAVLRALGPYLTDPELKAEATVGMNKVTKAMKEPAKLSASVNSDKAGNATDGKADTRWDTGAAMAGGEWFMVELPVEQEITKVTLDTRGSAGDYPRGYEVYISRDGKGWGKPVVTGKGTGPVTEIVLKPTFGRFVKIVQTGKTSGLFWSIHELKLESKEIKSN